MIFRLDVRWREKRPVRLFVSFRCDDDKLLVSFANAAWLEMMIGDGHLQPRLFTRLESGWVVREFEFVRIGPRLWLRHQISPNVVNSLFLPRSRIVLFALRSSPTEDRSLLFIWPFVGFLWFSLLFSDCSSCCFSHLPWSSFVFSRNSLEILVRTSRDHHTVSRYCETLLFE